ncbi:MAG: hypothetical protein KKD01_19480 [Proteobacteria bacterium]|nr:hypothetical protein [Pseudomonadota bacterium]
MKDEELTNVLQDIFLSQKESEYRDPNDELNQPYFAAKSKVINESYMRWYSDFGGNEVIGNLQRQIISQIISAILHPRNTKEERDECLRALDMVDLNLRFIQRIRNAFKHTKKRKEAKELEVVK